MTASSLRRSIVRAVCAAAERVARYRLRYSPHELSQPLLEHIERQDPATAREIRKLFGLTGGTSEKGN
jgi:hypothetical protein